MNVIVFSKRFGKARQFELGRPMAMTVTIATVMLVLGGVLFAGIQLGRSGLMLNSGRAGDGVGHEARTAAHESPPPGASCRSASTRSPAASAR